MTSRDQDEPPPTAWVEEPRPHRPIIISRISGGPSKSPETFGFEGTTDAQNSVLNGRDELFSIVISDDSQPEKCLDGRREDFDDKNFAKLLDKEAKGGITKRMSLTVESTRDEESICDNEQQQPA
jgi:hypothetical protein